MIRSIAGSRSHMSPSVVRRYNVRNGSERDEVGPSQMEEGLVSQGKEFGPYLWGTGEPLEAFK